MMVPIALMVFNRPDLTQRVIDQLALCKPHTLYVIADGPRSVEESPACEKTLEIALNPPWECDVVPFLRKKNVGMVRQFKEGLDFVFNRHDRLIFMEDDHLIAPSSYRFACELLDRFADDDRIGHINLSNFVPSFTASYEISYLFSYHFMVWGFGTWKRMWESYDVSMPLWTIADQDAILNRLCFSRREKKGVREMFDLHANNKNPWTYDYQWAFNCLNRNTYCITPSKNLCLNIGFDREDATHNKGKNPFANEIESLKFPLTHPINIERDLDFDRTLSGIIAPSSSMILKGKIRNKLFELFRGMTL